MASEIYLFELSDIRRLGIAEILSSKGISLAKVSDNLQELCDLDSSSSIIIVGFSKETYPLVEPVMRQRQELGRRGKIFCICSSGYFELCKDFEPLGYCTYDSNSELLVLAITAVAYGANFTCPSLTSAPIIRQARQAPDPVSFLDLSKREQDVLRKLAAGYSNHQISSSLGISLETVKSHVKHILTKLSVGSRTAAAVKAIEHGIVA